MQSIIEESLAKSCSYLEYRSTITALLQQGKVTGREQSEALVHYTELNEVRMKRLDKTVTISIDNIQKLEQLEGDYSWLVISEGWCGDAAQIIPVMHQMAECTEKIELKMVFRDENEELMNLFLTNGTKSIPKLIVLDKKTGSVVGNFGPRPQGAALFMQNYKATHGFIDEKAKTELQLWYFHDKGMGIQNEIMALMQSIESGRPQMPQE